MNIKTQYRRVAGQFESRSLAERLLISVLIVVALVWGFYSFYLTGVNDEREALARQITTTQTRIVTMQQREQQARIAGEEDPNQAVRVRIERAIAEQGRLDGNIEELAGNLVTPNSMTRLLTSMLSAQAGLKLARVENLAPETARAVGSDNTAAPVYKHRLIIELEGDYLSLIAYLVRLENFPERFFWDRLTFIQTEWPVARISLQLHTLSTAEGFVGV